MKMKINSVSQVTKDPTTHEGREAGSVDVSHRAHALGLRAGPGVNSSARGPGTGTGTLAALAVAATTPIAPERLRRLGRAGGGVNTMADLRRVEGLARGQPRS